MFELLESVDGKKCRNLQAAAAACYLVVITKNSSLQASALPTIDDILKECDIPSLKSSDIKKAVDKFINPLLLL